MSGKLKRKNFDRINDLDLNDFPERETPTSSHTQNPIFLDPKALMAKLISYDIKAVAKNESQKELINSIKNNEITICQGKPGSGKTYLSLVYALSLLQKKDNPYKKIYLVKSVAQLKGEELGFIKGSIEEKLTGPMWSFYHNIEKIIGRSNLDVLINSKVIEPLPIAFCKGANLDCCIAIFDEFQNISIENSKILMTRMGHDSKMVILGDVRQIDLRNKEMSGLVNIIKMFENTNGINIVKMNPNDISVRNPLIDVIEAKFDEFEENNKKVKINKREPLND